MSTKNQKSGPQPGRRLLTVAQVIEDSLLSESHVRRDIRSEELPSMRFGRAIRVAEDDYLAYLARHRGGP